MIYPVKHKDGMNGICRGMCGHYWRSKYGTRISPIKEIMAEPCPVCAEIEKRVKAARMEVLGKAMPLILNYLVPYIDEDSSELLLDRREFIEFGEYLNKLIEAKK